MQRTRRPYSTSITAEILSHGLATADMLQCTAAHMLAAQAHEGASERAHQDSRR